jgi:hypothetical protein
MAPAFAPVRANDAFRPADGRNRPRELGPSTPYARFAGGARHLVEKAGVGGRAVVESRRQDRDAACTAFARRRHEGGEGGCLRCQDDEIRGRWQRRQTPEGGASQNRRVARMDRVERPLEPAFGEIAHHRGTDGPRLLAGPDDGDTGGAEEAMQRMGGHGDRTRRTTWRDIPWAF